MNKADAIAFLYPTAKPMIDFEVWDNGDEYILREGLEWRERVEIRPLYEGDPETGEGAETEEIEDVHFRYRIRRLSEMTEGVDYTVENKGPYIKVWNIKDAEGNIVPQPTEAELQAAWDDLQANPPTVPETPEQKIARLEQAVVLHDQLNTSNMLAITELFELMLPIIMPAE